MKSEWILSDEEKRLKRLKIEENKRKRRSRQLQSGYVPMSPYSTAMDGSYLNGGVPSNASSNTASPLMLPNGQIASNNNLNSIVYDSQIDDSSMGSGFVVQPAPTFHNQFDKDRNPVNSSSYFNGFNPSNQEHIQQPEIVNRLVYSHYEQYKSGSDDLNNWESPEQYPTSLGSTPGMMDQFFSDQSSATLSSSLLSSVDSPFNIMSMVSNNLQSETTIEQSQPNQQNQQITQNYSSDQGMENSNQAGDVKPSVTMLNASQLMTVNCLSDAQMIDEIFEQAVAFKLNPPCKS